MDKKLELATKFFGFNKSQVEDYYNKLQLANDEKISALKETLEIRKKEKQMLYNELLILQEEKEKLSQQKEMLDLALLRAQETIALLQTATGEEVELILKKVNEEKNANNKQITEIESEIKNAKLYIETLIENVQKMLNEGLEDDDSNISSKVVGKIVPVYQNNKNQQNNNTHKQTDADQQIPLEEKEEVRTTADGMTLPEINKTGAKKNIDQQYEVFLENISQILEKKQTEEAATEEAAASANTGFWDEPDFVEEQELIEAETEMKLPKENTVPDSSYKSAAIADEIDNIRYKYIVGKFAGEDLRNSEGTLIIAKGQIITLEIVHAAETSGKLAELIVNMVIPGLE